MEDAVAGRLTGRNTKTEAQIPQNGNGRVNTGGGDNTVHWQETREPTGENEAQVGTVSTAAVFHGFLSQHPWWKHHDSVCWMLRYSDFCWFSIVSGSLSLVTQVLLLVAVHIQSPPPHTHTLGTCVYRALVCMCSLLWCLLLYLVWDSFMDLFCVRCLWSIK